MEVAKSYLTPFLFISWIRIHQISTRIRNTATSSVVDPDPYGSVSFGRIRIRFRRSGSGSGSRSQICQKLFIFEQNFNKFYAENAKFLLNIQGFEYLRRFLVDKGNPQNFSFQKKAKKFRNFDFLSRFGQDPDP